eukprot:TRINITY_DN17783_c0_g1_i1.p1 TRINITY_DN17783_c0_g1~~TRINITY_DN17783_c0_g1_i1.p1  ORF type:complete len:426 (-),score=61.67 TRINITY_DN17783_c0_g1_i1:48-1289(-)
MSQTCGISPEDLRINEGDYLAWETPLETAWTFWYDKKTSDRKESEQYMEGLKQLGSFNTIEGFYRHYTHLLRPSDLPRDHNVLLFRKGYRPMWEEFPEGGCWIIRIKRKASQNYVNRMWENLLLAFIGEEFELPDVVGCVLSTRLKDDVLSVWNLNNRDPTARFRIGEKLKEILDLDMNTLIQYKDHMQSLQDYSTYRNAKNYMFAPSPNATPLQGTLETPIPTPLVTHDGMPITDDLDQDLLPPAAIDTMLPPAAVDTEGFGSLNESWGASSRKASAVGNSPALSAQAAPWSPNSQPKSSPLLSAAAAPWSPSSASPEGSAPAVSSRAPGAPSPSLRPGAAPFYPSASQKAGADEERTVSASGSAGEGAEPGQPAAEPEQARAGAKSWAAIVSGGVSPKSKVSPKAKANDST